MQFSKEQEYAFSKFREGKNIFITGPGGTGKSALIKYMQEYAFKKGLLLQVCALTGCAAVLLNCKAKTLHSWAGIGLGNTTVEDMVNKIKKSTYKKKNWKDIQVLIVDEVSMLSKKLFEMLDAIGKSVKRNKKPFGGIQLIFSGDFYQLPPVGNKEEQETSQFCFESPLWFDTFEKENHILLTKIFRQNDEPYTKILNQIREGILKKSSVQRLSQNIGRTIDPESFIKPTKLFPTRYKVDNVNSMEMELLTTSIFQYKCKQLFDLPFTEKEKLTRKCFTPEQIQNELQYIQSNLLCEETIKLKVGSQVMCVVNMELANGEMLCNGSQGVVTRISADGLPVVKYNRGYEVPMGYHVWASETIPGIGVSQIPLILAWAITIHKSQGATLDIAEIDVGSTIFECGQTYVALSRVKSLDGLYLTSFDVNRIRINKKVREFYQTIQEYKESTMTNTNIPEAEAVLVEEVPICVAIPIVPNVDFSSFEFIEHEDDTDE